MSKYLIKASYSVEGVRGVRKEGGSSRRDTVEKMLAGLGGKLESFYFAFGVEDVFVIAEIPDAITAAALGLTINSSGLVSVSTTVLLTPEDIDQATKKSINYRAPGT